MSCPPLVSNYSTPRVQWYQTDLMIIIRIQLTDVHNYSLQVEDDHLLFSTIKDDKEYYLILYLFGSVMAEKTMHKNVDREIRVYLTKTMKWFPWLRLTLSDEKNPLISYDVQHIDEPQYFPANSQNTGEINKPKYRDMNIMPVVPSSDEEDDLYDENDEFFCE